jgi:hypothetical protein
MNLWACTHRGCKNTAVGSGGAIGLRAVGWYFVPGAMLRCPAHRPDERPCGDYGENQGKPCSQCAGEEEATRMQVLITHALAGEEPSMALVHVLHAGRAMCGRGEPDEWPPGDRGVDLDAWTEATCKRCQMNYSTASIRDPEVHAIVSKS